MQRRRHATSIRAIAVLTAFAFVACDSGGGSGGAGTGSASGTGGGAGTTGTAGLASGAGAGRPTGGTTGTEGATATGGTSAAGTGGAAGTAAGMGAGAGTAGAGGAGGAGGDGSSDCSLACEPGKHCELTVVQCNQAPCPPPVEECIDDPHCGGFAGLPCPGMGSCADDPRDDCDPMHGGADCGGICTCIDSMTCPTGQKWDSSPTVCACVASDASSGEACGKTTCDAGMVCCNASCGICTPPGGVCTQMACL